jgi:hypothetical protein
MTQSDPRLRPPPRVTAKRTSGRSSRWKRTGSALGIGSVSATVLVVLLFLAPSTLGSTVVPAVFAYHGKHGPPFSGTINVGQVIVTRGCSAFASFVTPPQFDLSTGIGRVYGNSSVKSCGPPGFSDFGATVGTTGLDSSTFVLKSPVPTQIWFNFSVSYTYNLSATPQNPAGGPSAWASYTLSVFAFAYDITTAVQGLGCAYNFSATTNGSATGNVSGGFHGPAGCGFGSFPSYWAVGNKYIIQIFVRLFEFADAPSASGTHAWARANMATGKHELDVHSWTIH